MPGKFCRHGKIRKKKKINVKKCPSIQPPPVSYSTLSKGSQGALFLLNVKWF